MIAGLHDQLTGASDEPSRRVDELTQALLLACHTPGRRARQLLERALGQDDCIQWIDQIGARIAGNPAINPEKARPLLRSIALSTSQRGTLKYAIALLGFCGNSEDIPLFETVGRHEEFTLYAAVALANTLTDPLEAWFRLAHLVRGWGKIDLVTRICEAKPAREDVRNWLLRHGCENEIMDEYLGLIVAEGADLVGALRQADPDDELIRGAGIILRAISLGGPAPGFEEYPEGPEAVRLFLNHLVRRPGALHCLVHAGALRDYMLSSECTWPDRLELLGLAAQVIAQPHWPQHVERYLASDNKQESWNAWVGARIIRVNVVPELTVQLRNRPIDPGLWYRFVAGCDSAVMETALDLAQELLPLQEMFTGPLEETEEFEYGDTPYSCLGFVLQALRDFPGKGEALLIRALSSKSVGNRTMALSVLHEWSSGMVTPEIRSAVEVCSRRDPSARVKRFAEETLAIWDTESAGQ
jgi:hypothetical protein